MISAAEYSQKFAEFEAEKQAFRAALLQSEKDTVQLKAEVEKKDARIDEQAAQIEKLEAKLEWIVDQGSMTHRRFIPGGNVTGFPNQIPGR